LTLVFLVCCLFFIRHDPKCKGCVTYTYIMHSTDPQFNLPGNKACNKPYKI
jgi:hypothetical protein